MGNLKNNLKRLLSAGLALAIGTTCLPATAFAASESRLSSVTARFIDAEDGRQIAADETYSVTHKVFSDVPDGHWAHSYINAAADAGWIKGYPDGTFRPDKNITRAEAVTLVNGMINRSIALEQLTKLGVRNPYNDLAQSYWAYCDILEATVSHSAEEWHGISYNGGKYNVIIEKYVDENGKPLAGTTTRAGKPEEAPKAIPAYEYRGYIRTITYKYVSGDARPAIEKTAGWWKSSSPSHRQASASVCTAAWNFGKRCGRCADDKQEDFIRLSDRAGGNQNLPGRAAYGASGFRAI